MPTVLVSSVYAGQRGEETSLSEPGFKKQNNAKTKTSLWCSNSVWCFDAFTPQIYPCLSRATVALSAETLRRALPTHRLQQQKDPRSSSARVEDALDTSEALSKRRLCTTRGCTWFQQSRSSTFVYAAQRGCNGLAKHGTALS